MLDIKFIKENREAVKEAVKKKYMKVDIDHLLEIDEKRRKLIQECESLKSEQNKLSEGMAKERSDDDIKKSAELKERIKSLKEGLNAVQKEYDELMLLVPNIPVEGTPVGPNDESNKIVSEWGKKPDFDFEPKDHVKIGSDLDIIDLETGVKVSGFRGYYLKNQGAALHLAVLWYAYQKMIKKGFNPLVGPTLVKDFVLTGSGHFPFGKEEVYQIGNPGKLSSGESIKEPLYLAGTSEPTLLSYFSDKTLEEKDLPVKVCGFSPCYRSEAGSYGKDTKGLYRIHEFMKVEQVLLCRNDIDESEKWLDEMRLISEEIVRDLKLPYRVVQNSTGDMGAGKYKMYDIETWMPGRGSYGETHSDSSLTDWQARRLNIRYKDSEGNVKFVHTLNNTVLASPRILIAILENYQRKDGSVEMPKVLRDFLGFKEIRK